MATPKPQNKPEVPPGALSNLTPGAGGIIQLTPEDEVFVNDYAQQNSIPKAEALRRLLLHSQAQRDMPEKPTIFQKGMDAIAQANQLGFGTQQDPNSALNMMGSALAMKHVGDALKGDQGNDKKGKISIDDIKELMYLRMMGNLAGDNSNQTSTIVQDMKSENEKLRQELKDAEAKRATEMDKLKGDMRDMLFEKKIETLEATNTQTTNGLANQLAEISQRIELFRNPPANATPEQAKDAITHLEDLGKQVTRIKGVFSELGIIPAGQPLTPSAPGTEPYREKDGSVNTARYAIEKLTGALEKGMEAWEKKKPDLIDLDKKLSPLMEGFEQKQTPVQNGHVIVQMDMSAGEYYNFLRTKSQLNADELNWLTNNEHHFSPTPAPQPPVIKTYTSPHQPHEPPHHEPQPEPIETQKPEPKPEAPGEKKSVVERLKEQEEEEIRRAGL